MALIIQQKRLEDSRRLDHAHGALQNVDETWRREHESILQPEIIHHGSVHIGNSLGETVKGTPVNGALFDGYLIGRASSERPNVLLARDWLSFMNRKQ